MAKVQDPIAQVIQRDLARFAQVTSPRRVDLVNLSIFRDVGSWLLGNIPGVGSFISDAFGDNMYADMKRRMTPEEVDTFTEVTRRWPDSVALIQTFQRLPEETW